MSSEREFIHDLVNKLTIAQGKLNRIILKADKFTKEEVLENAAKAKNDLDEAFKLITTRQKEISE